MFLSPSVALRILSDWLEVKLGGGGGGSEAREEQPDGALQTLCVTDTLRDEGQRTHRVHVSIKVSLQRTHRGLQSDAKTKRPAGRLMGQDLFSCPRHEESPSTKTLQKHICLRGLYTLCTYKMNISVICLDCSGVHHGLAIGLPQCRSTNSTPNGAAAHTAQM